MPTERLVDLLEKFDIPVQRKHVLNKNNLVWLQKNLPKKNAEKKLFPVVYREVCRRVEQKDYVN